MISLCLIKMNYKKLITKRKQNVLKNIPQKYQAIYQ